MVALATIPLTCWLCVLLARPGKPLPGNETQELVYARLLGRQQRLNLLALLVTSGALLFLLLTLPERIDTDLHTIRNTHADCIAQVQSTDAVSSAARCYELQAGGVWVRESLQRDGSWQPLASVTAPIALDDTIHGRKP